MPHDPSHPSQVRDSQICGPRFPSVGLAEDERGTASMELLLGLPFLALILVLTIDAGYVFLSRIDTDVATRLAATSHLHGPDGRRTGVAKDAVQTHYGHLSFLRLDIREHADRGSFEEERSRPGGWSGIASRLSGWIAGLGRKVYVESETEVRLPIGTRLRSSPAEARFTLVGNTWTYEEVPLSMSGLVDQLTELESADRRGTGFFGRVFRIVARVVGYTMKGFFWLLGIYP